MHYTLNRNLRRNTKKYIHFNFNLYSNLCIVQCYEYVLSVAGIFRTTPQKIVKTLCWSPSCLVTACTTVAQPPPGKNLQSFFTSLLRRPTACEACNHIWSYSIILMESHHLIWNLRITNSIDHLFVALYYLRVSSYFTNLSMDNTQHCRGFPYQTQKGTTWWLSHLSFNYI